jgi:hypothetical protein
MLGTRHSYLRPSLAGSAAQGVERLYWITVAKPACVMRVVTGLVDPSVAAATAPDDVVTTLEMCSLPLAAPGGRACPWRVVPGVAAGLNEGTERSARF